MNVELVTMGSIKNYDNAFTCWTSAVLCLSHMIGEISGKRNLMYM